MAKRIYTNKNSGSTENMADRRKAIKGIYESDRSLRTWTDTRSSSSAANLYSQESLDRILDQVGLSTLDRNQIRTLSNFAYSTSPTYTSVFDYLTNMYLWRYYYTPVQIKDSASEKDYSEMYDLMTNIIDGLNIEVTFPDILTKLLTEGSVYLYTMKHTPSKTVSTIMLNPDYCSPVMKSQYGTGVFRFDLKYFDDLGFRDDVLENVLELFPKELVKAYNAYKNQNEERYIVLDGRYSTYIRLNENNFPNRLSVISSLIHYDEYKENEVERSSSQLDRVVTHKIPSFQNQLLFDLKEVQDLHKGMSRAIGGSKRTKLMTTFGDVQIHPLQPDSKVQNETLDKGHEEIFRSAGVNPSLFTGSTPEALNYSIQRDANTIWRYIQELIAFYNVSINNLYNFKGYQVQLTMLPITHYNADEKQNLYRKNAEYGVGRLELIVASGTKQKDIVHKSKLEEYLKLDEVLKPLKSSHTQTNEGNNKDDNDNDNPSNEDETTPEGQGNDPDGNVDED